MAAIAVGSQSPSPAPQISKLHNTSYTLTRLTPLYGLNTSRLQHYAREFRDIVRGDVLRGVHINDAPSNSAKSSLIRSCEWIIENDIMPGETFDTLSIKVTWEDGSNFIAFFLPNFTSSESVTLGKRKRGSSVGNGPEFTSLPLLLMKGHHLVKEQLITYLTTRFDSRSSELEVPPELLAECLQGYLERLFRAEPTPQTLERNLKIVEIIFNVPQPSNTKVKGALRKITFSFPARDVQEFYRRSPTVLESLTKHVVASTAISLSSLSLGRIACGGLVLDSGGRMKIFDSAGMESTTFILSKVVALAAKAPLKV